MATSAILEIIASIEMMNANIIPGVNVEKVDGELSILDYILERYVQINSFLKTSAGFNGVYGAVCISKNKNLKG
ncbi:MAG TPA: hypothetical protein EYG72_00595 [Candidatus Pacebacteria bacterium]|nr:hypothetical protein [Candidatus Paceibacterota bacterium]